MSHNEGHNELFFHEDGSDLPPSILEIFDEETKDDDDDDEPTEEELLEDEPF